MQPTSDKPQASAALPIAPEPFKQGSRLAFAAFAMAFLTLAGLVASLFVGDVTLDLATIGNALFHYNANLTPHILVHDGRLPRALADVLVGASLAVAGAIMQGMTRNPLASPGIMGLNNGASFLTLLAMVYVPWFGRPQLMVVSMLGAGLGVVLVYGIASLSRGGLTPVRLALTGIAVSALLGAVGNGLMIYYEMGQDMLIWQARGTDNVQWLDVELFAPLAAVGLLGAFILAPTLTVMSLGEHVAQGLGQRTKMAKCLASILVLVLAGGANAAAGPIGFVGLMIPHIVRHLVGHHYRLVIPGSALGGAILLLAADIVARLATTPYKAPVPVSVITALIGVPFFLYLACRRAKSGRARGGSL